MSTMTAIEYMPDQEDEPGADESIPASSDSARTSKDGVVVVVGDPPFGSSIAPCAAEQTVRSRIDKFVAGYALTPMGKAVAFNWIMVRFVCLRWLYPARKKSPRPSFYCFLVPAVWIQDRIQRPKDIGAPHNQQPFFYPRKVLRTSTSTTYRHIG